MVSKHITRDYSAHRKSVIRPYDEYCGLEIFSFDPQYTRTFLPRDVKILSNSKSTPWKSWSCLISSDFKQDMSIEISYNVVEYGEYRIDILYEQSNHLAGTEQNQTTSDKKLDTGQDLTGDIIIKAPNRTVRNEEVLFDGENNIVKRKTFFNQLNQGKHTIQFNIPHNCYFMGIIVRKIVKYTANNYYGADMGKDEGNMMLLSANLTISDMTKPSEFQCEIGYDDAFECDDSPSGFYIDYRDEVNFYVKDDDKQIERVFGGYVSSILPNDNRTKLTIHCADRLVDGQNKYILDEIALAGGTKKQSEDEYSDGMTKNFNSYGEALKYLCDCHEITLKSNIAKNFLVDGEKNAKGLTITYGSNKRVKSIKASNGKTKVHKNYIMLRNNPSSSKKQTWKLYDASKHSKKPILLNDKPYMHISYGLGSPKTELKSKTTEKVDTADTTAGSQKFTKCGVSEDKKYIMAIGLPSAGKDSKKGWTKTVFKRKCPHCGSSELYWGIFWGTVFPCTGRAEGGSAEGHIFCKSCDADYSVQGWEHISGSTKHLEKESSTVASSRKEANKLKNGEMTAVPSTSVEVTSDDVFKAISKIAFKYKYKLGTTSSYSAMKKSGSGDCWAFSDLILTEMKKYGISSKIVQYSTSEANNHRSVLYKNEKNKWVDFPYREYGWGTRYNNMLNNTSGSKHGSKIEEFKGKNIGNVKTSTSTSKTQTTTVTTTKGYDKDKPFQSYLKITYSSVSDAKNISFKSKKKNLYIKFTHTATEKNALNTTSFPVYWVNNTVKKSTLIGEDKHSFNLVDYIHHIENSNNYIYLQSIQMITPVVKQTKDNKDTDWYKYDKSTIDESSCKINLYQIVFNDDSNDPNPDEKNSCGKSVNELMKTLTEESGYLVDMEYGLHRNEDKINFRVDNASSVQYTATEGDNNNILSWNSISYSPISSLYNSSIEVFKNYDGTYSYVDTRYTDSVMQYGEQTTLQTINEPTNSQEAYYLARTNEKFNNEQTYSYTVTVPNYPDLRLGDYIQVVANAKKLSTIKELKSIKISFDSGKIPRIRTELGLDELAPSILLKENIRKLRQSAKKDTTSFSKSAVPVNDSSIYIWDR